MARKANPRAQSVAASQARVIDAGGTWLPKTLLQPEEAALWAKARERHGSAKDTLVAALRALAGGEPSNAELIAMLDARLNGSNVKLARGVKVTG